MSDFTILKELQNNSTEQKKTFLEKGAPRGIDHIGITVPDMDVAVKFLEEAFNATIIYELVPKGSEGRSGKHVEETLALPDGSIITRQTLMRLGVGPSIELFQFEGVNQNPSSMLNDFGLQHFTVYVEDIEKSVAAVKKAGCEPYYRPHRPAGYEGAKGNMGCYVRPPWGGIVELFQYTDIEYPDKNKTRWTPPRPMLV